MKSYLTTKELEVKANISRSTVLRLTKDLMKEKDNWNMTYIKEGKNKKLFHHSLLKRFIPEWCLKKLDENEENLNCMRNLITVLEDQNTLAYTLYKLKWDNFITVAYKATYTPERCFSMMSKLSDRLEEKCGKDIEVRLFFTTESFTTRDGNHNHFFLRVGNHKIREYAIDFIKEYFTDDRVDIRPYDNEKAGLFYICKNNSTKGINWDLRGNKLSSPR